MGDVITDSRKLIARTPEAFAKSGIDVKLNTAVEAIDTGSRTVTLDSGDRLAFDRLVLATGAAPRPLAVPGEDLPGVFFLHDVADALRIKAHLNRNGGKRCRRAVVVGAGFIGLELCEAFRALGLDTVLMHRSELPMRRLAPTLSEKIVQTLADGGVRFMPGFSPAGFEVQSDGSLRVATEMGAVEADLVVVAIGVAPEVGLARTAGATIGATGAVAVDERMATGVPGIYAAGDCCECRHLVSGGPVYLPLGDVANKQGRVAGTNLGGGDARFPGVVGSSCLKVFDLEVAFTGLTMAEAQAAGFDPAATTIAGRARAHAYPGAEPLTLQLVADRAGGRLLGAQAVGNGGVVARINALALAVTAGMTVGQLAMADFAYSPPFSGSWDPIHIAAQKLDR